MIAKGPGKSMLVGAPCRLARHERGRQAHRRLAGWRAGRLAGGQTPGLTLPVSSPSRTAPAGSACVPDAPGDEAARPGAPLAVRAGALGTALTGPLFIFAGLSVAANRRRRPPRSMRASGLAPAQNSERRPAAR